jgi:hypothetical protein
MTAVDRCLGHVGGTAGEDDVARTWRWRHQLGRWARPVQGDPSLVGKAPKESRQLYLSVAADGLGDVLATWCEVAVAPAC